MMVKGIIIIIHAREWFGLCLSSSTCSVRQMIECSLASYLLFIFWLDIILLFVTLFKRFVKVFNCSSFNESVIEMVKSHLYVFKIFNVYAGQLSFTYICLMWVIEIKVTFLCFKNFFCFYKYLVLMKFKIALNLNQQFK